MYKRIIIININSNLYFVCIIIFYHKSIIKQKPTITLSTITFIYCLSLNLIIKLFEIPFSMNSSASRMNPYFSSLYIQDVCFGLLWFNISAKGTNASVFTPLIEIPNILELTVILAQQNSSNVNYVNSGAIFKII